MIANTDADHSQNRILLGFSEKIRLLSILSQEKYGGSYRKSSLSSIAKYLPNDKQMTQEYNIVKIDIGNIAARMQVPI